MRRVLPLKRSCSDAPLPDQLDGCDATLWEARVCQLVNILAVTFAAMAEVIETTGLATAGLYKTWTPVAIPHSKPTRPGKNERSCNPQTPVAKAPQANQAN